MAFQNLFCSRIYVLYVRVGIAITVPGTYGTVPIRTMRSTTITVLRTLLHLVMYQVPHTVGTVSHATGTTVSEEEATR